MAFMLASELLFSDFPSVRPAFSTKFCFHFCFHFYPEGGNSDYTKFHLESSPLKTTITEAQLRYKGQLTSDACPLRPTPVFSSSFDLFWFPHIHSTYPDKPRPAFCP